MVVNSANVNLNEQGFLTIGPIPGNRATIARALIEAAIHLKRGYDDGPSWIFQKGQVPGMERT
jgi:hypothetical protein